ncbi:hypothetical protein HK098_002175, partial [Nowakowskiella sp. JEL0407]
MFSTQQQQQKDIEVVSPPSDGISDLAFSPVADYLAASSWDNHTRIWEIQGNGSSIPKAQIEHTAPALCTSWSKDGTKVFSGGADKVGKVLDLQTGQTSQFASHDAPIKCSRWVDGVNGMNNIIVTGSWDKTVKYWDLRTPTPASVLQLPERCYTMDLVFPLMVVGTAEKHLLVYHLANPTVVFKNVPSPLKHQTRVVSCFPSATGFAVGSIEGRVGIQNVEEKDA